MPGTPIDYRQFGQNLLDRVITTKRVNDLVHAAIGERVELAHGAVNIRFTATSTVNRFEVVADKAPELGFAIAVTVEGKDLPAELTDGIVEHKIRDQVIKGANQFLGDTAARTFDLAPLVEQGVERLGRQ